LLVLLAMISHKWISLTARLMVQVK